MLDESGWLIVASDETPACRHVVFVIGLGIVIPDNVGIWTRRIEMEMPVSAIQAAEKKSRGSFGDCCVNLPACIPSDCRAVCEISALTQSGTCSASCEIGTICICQDVDRDDLMVKKYLVPIGHLTYAIYRSKA